MLNSDSEYKINDVIIPCESHYYQNGVNEPNHILSDLAKINIFIGENNSGKSRLLREILRNDLQYMPSYQINDVNQILSDLKKDLREPFISRRDKPFTSLENFLNSINDVKIINKDFNLSDKLLKLKDYLFKLTKDTGSSTNNYLHTEIGNKLLSIFQSKFTLLHEKFPDCLDPPKFTKIYIPIMRGLKPLDNGEYGDVYYDKIKQDYFSNAEPDFTIFTGISAYKDIRSHLLGNLSQRKLIKDYEEYLSRTFFDNQPVTIIPSEIYKHLTIKIGQEKEQPIQDLGDGLQSIIILTLPLFLHKGENVLLFIDEPELYVHPGLQRKIIETLLNEDGFEKFQYFLTTHSNHFLDITLDYRDISVFSVNKRLTDLVKDNDDEQTPIFLIQNLSCGDHKALELLGVRNSSVFLSNCTIWVEGITDRLYFRHYLALLIKKDSNENNSYKEDLHYSFVEYSGGNITHWSFLDKSEESMDAKRLCSKLFLIADKDDRKEKRHEILKENLGDNVHILNCREVENLIAAPILLKIIQDYENNNELVLNLNYSQYQNKSLGKFIDDKLGCNRKRVSTYSTSSGTVIDKIGFCNKAIKYIQTWNDLSPEAKEITEKIFDFIKKNNPNNSNRN